MGWGYYGGNGGWLGMFIMPLILIVMLVVVFSFTSRLLPWGNRHHIQHPETPMEILKRRYASGEMSKTEFDDMKRELAN